MPYDNQTPLGAFLGAKQKAQSLQMGAQRLKAGKQQMSMRTQAAERQTRMEEVNQAKMEQQEQRDTMTDMGKAAQWADTPEKWEQALDAYEKGGIDVADYRDGFHLRDAVAALAGPNQDLAMRKLQLEEEKFRKTKIGAQVILEDGSIIQSTDKGRVVYGPEGNKLTGDAAAKAIETSRATKVSNIRKAAGEKKRATLEAEGDLKAKVEAGVISAKEAAKTSVKSFEKLEKVNIAIANTDEAIKLLDGGATTNVMKAKLPSIRAASIKLDNLQKRMGLDIIGAVTFGALSQGELDLALSTALPTNLETAELRKWLTDKKQAQDSMADYLESAAIFLGTPGNTHADWLKHQKKRFGDKKEQQEPANIQSLIDKYAQ